MKVRRSACRQSARLLALAGVSGLAALAVAAPAQLVQSTPGVQSSQTSDLNRNLARLAENPRDVDALIGAGEAALDLNDGRAATGFFARAQEIDPNNGRIKAGLGRAMIKLQNSAEALKLFDQAVRLGYSERNFQSDRGLARDLNGDQAGAQADYSAVLARTPNDRITTRRYAISLGISGQVDAAEKVIKPLLYDSDRAAWRDRAFILAMNGRRDQATTITHQVMPQQLADAIQPYMDRMPLLSSSQRAEAVHFGKFPTQVRSASAPPAAAAPATALASADATKKPASTRRKSRKEREREAADLARAQAEERARQAQLAAAEPKPPAPPPAQPQFAARQPVVQPLPAQARPASTPNPAAGLPSAATPPVSSPATASSSQTPMVQPLPEPRRSGERIGARFNRRIGDTPKPIEPAPSQAEPPRETRLASVDSSTSGLRPAGTLDARLPAASPSPANQAPAPRQAEVQGPADPLGPQSRFASRATPPAAAPTQAQAQAQSQASAAVQPGLTAASRPFAPAASDPEPATMPPPSPAPAAPVLAQPEPASTPPVAQQVAAAPSPAPAPVDAGAEGDRSLADIMRELDVPDSEKAQSVVPVNLADIAKIQEQKRQTDQAMADLRKKQAADKAKAEAAKAKAAADAKAKAEAERLKKNPERNWVQVGTGRSISALGFTWGKLQKQYAGMKGKSAFTASWGATNRLVIGPFASFAKAKEVEAELKKDGADCFAWQSRAGEEVSGLK